MKFWWHLVCFVSITSILASGTLLTLSLSMNKFLTIKPISDLKVSFDRASQDLNLGHKGESPVFEKFELLYYFAHKRTSLSLCGNAWLARYIFGQSNNISMFEIELNKQKSYLELGQKGLSLKIEKVTLDCQVKIPPRVINWKIHKI